MIINLTQTRGTNLNSSYWDIEKLTTIDVSLVDVTNAIISGWQSKPSVKSKALKKLKKPTTPAQRKDAKRFATMDKLLEIRARRKAPEGG